MLRSFDRFRFGGVCLICLMLSVLSAAGRMFESFEYESFPPPGWTKTNLLGGSGWYRLPIGVAPLPGWGNDTSSVPPTAGAGTHNAYVSWDTGGSASEGYHSDQWLISPRLTGLTATSTVSYWLRLSFSNYPDVVYFKVSTNGPAPSQFTITGHTYVWSKGGNIGQFGPWSNVVVNIGQLGIPAGTPLYIAFQEYVWDNTWNGAAVQLDAIGSDLTPTPFIRMDPVSFNTTFRSNPAPQTIPIRNIGSGNLSFSSSITYAGGQPSGWLSMSTTSGTLDVGEQVNTTLSVNSSSLARGTYNATVHFSMPGALSSTAVAVTLVNAMGIQYVTFPNPGPQPATNVLHLSAVANSGLPLTYAVTEGPAILSGNNLSFVGTGYVSVIAFNYGNADWLAPPVTTNRFLVSKVEASVTLHDLVQPYTGGSRTVWASTVPQGLGVSISYSGQWSPPVNPGNYVVTGRVTDACHSGLAVAILTVQYEAAEIFLDDLVHTYDKLGHHASATTAPEGLAVAFSYNGNSWWPTNAGSYVVTGAVSDVIYGGSSTGILVISKGSQAISFPQPCRQAITNTLPLQATSSSGLAVSYEVLSGPGSMLDASNLVFSDKGRVHVQATQAGDSNWYPAEDVVRLVFSYDPVSYTTFPWLDLLLLTSERK